MDLPTLSDRDCVYISSVHTIIYLSRIQVCNKTFGGFFLIQINYTTFVTVDDSIESLTTYREANIHDFIPAI